MQERLSASVTAHKMANVSGLPDIAGRHGVICAALGSGLSFPLRLLSMYHESFSRRDHLSKNTSHKVLTQKHLLHTQNSQIFSFQLFYLSFSNIDSIILLELMYHIAMKGVFLCRH